MGLKRFVAVRDGEEKDLLDMIPFLEDCDLEDSSEEMFAEAVSDFDKNLPVPMVGGEVISKQYSPDSLASYFTTEGVKKFDKSIAYLFALVVKFGGSLGYSVETQGAEVDETRLVYADKYRVVMKR